MQRFWKYSLLLFILLQLSGCFAINRMDGVSQARELQKAGEPADATILQVWDTGMTLGHDPVVGLLLQVNPREGTPFQARTKCLISRLDTSQFQPGNVVPVRFDPKDHTRVSVDLYKY